MAKKSLYPLTESMYYVLLSFHKQDMCGTEIAEYVRNMTNNRVRLGPGTLYTILDTFRKEKVIVKVSSEGRKIRYKITEKGESLFNEEFERLKACIADAEGGR
ncbi:MAG TPA: PadR family transcriptional regulator [Mogibacterium sp.]|nr:PadR family transcriptional regulator [Mogibacterium sp.]